MKKAVIYSRVSTFKQDYKRQLIDLQDYAKKNDYEVAATFTDTISGKTKPKERDGFKKMLETIEKEKVSIVLFAEVSRIARNAIDAQTVIDILVNEYRVNVYIQQQGFAAFDEKGKSNPFFKILTDLLANLAQMEREQISERTKSKLNQKRKEYQEHNRLKGLKKGDNGFKQLGRPNGTTKTKDKVLTEYRNVVRQLERGTSIRNTAKICEVSAATVQKVKKAMPAN